MDRKRNEPKGQTGQVHEMRKVLGRLVDSLERQRTMAMSVEQDLAVLQRVLSPAPVKPPLRAARREGCYEELQRRQAQSGAGMLEIHFEGAGARVRLNGAGWFSLAALPALLLLIISDDSNREDDGFPRWQTHAEIAEQLRARSGRASFVPTKVPHLVHRLRKALRENDANPFWVETSGSKGVRFLQLRREVQDF